MLPRRAIPQQTTNSMERILALRIARGARAQRNLWPSTIPARRPMSSGPSVIQPSFWKSMIPKPFRRRKTGHHPEFLVSTDTIRMTTAPKSKEWNPATFFIIIFLFIGSMSIQMIALRREFNAFTRRADVRIGILREVVEKLQRGEQVDVEKALGTGDAQKELEWEQVLREIESDDVLRNAQKSNSRSRLTPGSPGVTTQTQSTLAPSQREAAPKETPATSESETKAKPTSFSSFF